MIHHTDNLCRQLQDLILVKQQAVDECEVLKQKAEMYDQRIFELEERNLTLENELSKTYKNLEILQGINISVTRCIQVHCIAEKLEYTTKQSEANQSELKLEQRQASLLKAEVNTLK